MTDQGGNLEEHILNINNMTASTARRISNNSFSKDFQESNSKLSRAKMSMKSAQEDMKKTIQEFLSVEEAEASIQQELQSQTLGPQAKNTMSQITDAKKQIGNLDQELACLQSTISHKREALQQVQGEITTSHQNTSTCISRIRADFCTFTKLSSLKWDYSASGDTIKGFILQPEKKTIVPFEFDKTSHSLLFITNYLWQQIYGDSGFGDDL